VRHFARDGSRVGGVVKINRSNSLEPESGQRKSYSFTLTGRAVIRPILHEISDILASAILPLANAAVTWNM